MKSKSTTCILLIPLLFCLGHLQAQKIPAYAVIPTHELHDYLKPEVRQTLSTNNDIPKADLAAYFRKAFQERFFYDWRTVGERFTLYDKLYGNQKSHTTRAKDHLAKYADSTQWVLPFNYQNGSPVNAYALRHLARQHKMLDIAYLYFYDQQDPDYIRYFTRQMHSLNVALEKSEYESIKDGNGVYEVFRSGYRILNWLSIHNLFLGQETYSDQDQLYTIATLLQHGAHLYQKNDHFRAGNHQTRGMSALAMLAILLRDFQDTDLWYKRAMTRLNEHLAKEINKDGFQFERSVHYHISDISNYFYVYQLAQINGIEVDAVWEERLRVLFESLVKIAYPNKNAPVLQDDTDDPWAETNQISRTMTLGYLLFGSPEFGYFADKKVEGKLYWFVSKKQLEKLKSIKGKKPKIRSTSFPQTGYYITREGWNKNNKVMIISAGLDPEKPDHQHGDMLGVQAVANGNTILPNYQVRYSLPDYDLFKNSMVKNVALVDNVLQGKKWKGNKGKSGFGKFLELPKPKVLVWDSNPRLDVFVGTHDGFSDQKVAYTRQVIYLKDDFWIVKDNFNADAPHTYKQVWQGHYTSENGPGLLRSSFADGSGCDIFQLQAPDTTIKSGARGKEWTVLSKTDQTNFSFISIIYPFSGYEKRINEDKANPKINGWIVNETAFEAGGVKSLAKKEEAFLFDVIEIKLKGATIQFEDNADIYMHWSKEKKRIQSLGSQVVAFTISEQLNGKTQQKNITLRPGEAVDFE